MQAFLYFDLTPDASFRKPVVEQVRQQIPAIAILDLDANSGELLQHYALRLLREADRTVVCIKADGTTAPLDSLMPLLEELFEEEKQRLVLLQGTHARLQRIFSARPQVAFKVVADEQVVREIIRFVEKQE